MHNQPDEKVVTRKDVTRNEGPTLFRFPETLVSGGQGFMDPRYFCVWNIAVARADQHQFNPSA